MIIDFPLGRHVCSSIFHLARDCLTIFLTLDMIYNKCGANHAHMQRRIQADAVFRRRYFFVEKANLVAIVRTRMTEDRVSFSQAADSVGVPLSTLYKWQADLPLTPSTLKQDHQGPPSFIHDIEPQLLSFIYEWRERGMPVSCFSVVQKAIQLKPEFAKKTMRARTMCVSGFLHKHDLVHCVGTRTSQKPP